MDHVEASKQALNEQDEFARRAKLFHDYMNSDQMKEILLQRLKINDAASHNVEARAMTYELCKRDDNPAEGCIFFIENFGWTFDPRKEVKHIPFVLFDFQREAVRQIIDHIDNGRDLFLEKSRDMGITWVVTWVFIWYWLFRDGSNLLLGSYKEKLVDDGTDDSLFGRLDVSIRSLPKWLWPKGYNPKKHRTKLKIVNPVNNNLLAGDTMNPDFGRGFRKTAIFFDELGFWDYAEDAWGTCGDTTACRIANSTPNGQNFYADLRDTGIDVFTMHWTQHPLKDDLWYAFECARRSEEEVAQEIDISYTKSQEGRVYKEWNDQNVFWGYHEYNPQLPLYVGWDFGKEDPTTIIWCQPENGHLNIIDTYTKNGENIDYFIPFITGILPSEENLNYRYTKYDLELIESHKHWKRGVHFGDPAGRNRNQINDATVLSVLREHGIVVNFKEQWKTFQNRKRAAKALIREGIHINTNDRTKKFAKCIDQASYPQIRREGTKEINSVKPKHDWTSHYRSAFEYLALGLEDFTHRRTTPKDSKQVVSRDRRGRRRALSY